MINKEVIDRLKLLYKEKKYQTYKDFALELGAFSNHISAIFNYKKDISKDLMDKIIKKLNVNPTWLLLGKGSMFQNPQEEEKMRKRIMELEKQVADLKKENQNLDIELAETKNTIVNLAQAKLVKA